MKRIATGHYETDDGSYAIRRWAHGGDKGWIIEPHKATVDEFRHDLFTTKAEAEKALKAFASETNSQQPSQ